MIPWPFLLCQKPIVSAPVAMFWMIGMQSSALAVGASFEEASARVVDGHDGAESMLLSASDIPVS